MIRRPPRSTLSSSSAASDVYKRQGEPQRPTPAGEQHRHHMLELLLDGREGPGELRVDLGSQLLDEGAELVDGLLEIAALFAQEGGALAELGALRLGEGVYGADALAPAAQPLEVLAELPGLVEGSGELGAAVLEARQRHLDRRAPLAEVGQVATQAGLPLGQGAELTAVERRVGLLARVEALDERPGVPAQARDPRRERLADLAHLGQLLEAAFDLPEPPQGAARGARD